jgi:hypothetical protein
MIKNTKKISGLVATTEQQWDKLCQQDKTTNVHGLRKIVWQQGSLEAVRRYIGTDSSHTYTDNEFVKLLGQAQHQRVMLISDTAGLGKSTVRTHMSKIIQRKPPTKWVVRIDLNDHTDELKVLKEEHIHSKKVIEFVSESAAT